VGCLEKARVDSVIHIFTMSAATARAKLALPFEQTCSIVTTRCLTVSKAGGMMTGVVGAAARWRGNLEIALSNRLCSIRRTIQRLVRRGLKTLGILQFFLSRTKGG
jgi:hypothetical protein